MKGCLGSDQILLGYSSRTRHPSESVGHGQHAAELVLVTDTAVTVDQRAVFRIVEHACSARAADHAPGLVELVKTGQIQSRVLDTVTGTVLGRVLVPRFLLPTSK